MSDIIVGMDQQAAATAGGTQTFSDSTKFGGKTPKAAMFYVTSALTAGTPADQAIWSHGACDAVAQWASTNKSEHGQSSTDTDGRGVTDECIIINDLATGVDGEAAFSSFSADSVAVAWGNAPAAGYLITCVMFGGNDLEVDVGTVVLGTEDTEANITDPGFEPDLVIIGFNGQAWDDVNSLQWRNNIGFVQNTGVGINQRALFQKIGDGDSRANTECFMSAIRCAGQIAGGGLTWAVECSNFDSGGFSLTPRSGDSGGDEIGWLALKTGDNGVWVGSVTPPTSTGDGVETGPGFVPQFVMLGMSQLPTEDAGVAGADGGTFGVSVFTDDQEFSISAQTEDNSNTSDTQSAVDTNAVFLEQDDGSAGFAATGPSGTGSFDALGWTLDFSAVEGSTCRWIGLAIEESAVVAVTAIPLTMAPYQAIGRR